MTISFSDELLYADGFEDALIGVGQQFNTELAVYDWDKCVNILIERDGVTHEEAVEFMDYNVTGVWMGEHTPVFIIRLKQTDEIDNG